MGWNNVKNPCHATVPDIWKIFHGRLYVYKNTKVGGIYFYKNVFVHIVQNDHTFVSTTFLLFQAFRSAAFLLELIFIFCHCTSNTYCLYGDTKQKNFP
jgi:hypothetical protein